MFAITLIVFYLSAERTGSLWDCGEFIAGAYKLQVVHPPGAPLFLLIGRLFTLVAETFSSNPETIAFSVNLLSGVCTSLAATMVCWVTIRLAKLIVAGREESLSDGQMIACLLAGASAGLATAFSTSIWFSAVEGEVYAMSTFFTALTLWAMIKWYSLPDHPESDRWIIFAIYSAALSIGVHLLSLLTFPALALFYYFKKYKNPNLKGMAIAAIAGVAFIGIIQKVIIVGIPALWAQLELIAVNQMGLPYNSGLIPLAIIIFGVFFLALRYAQQRKHHLLQQFIVAMGLSVIGFSTVGVVVLRANANPPINMNAPSDAMRLLPYLNREQYGERPLLRGPHYMTKIQKTELKDRYGKKNGRYEVVDQKASYIFDSKDQMLFPRLGHLDAPRRALYQRWLAKKTKPNMVDNISFFFRYQIRWMYWRYFMWNFSGRQNGQQGFYPWDKSSGHWISGIPFIDNIRLGNQAHVPESMLDQANNKYYLLPFIFGLIGLLFHAKEKPNDFLGLLSLFLITGLGIIVYSNQPPNEPRERDYVLAGSFFTYCIWIGLGVLAISRFLVNKLSLDGKLAAGAAGLVVLTAPLLMVTQNFDDMSRAEHKASRDYAANFLNSCEENAILFTYGDNDTYPLWYAQEVEGIRTDVRVVNLSLIAVDWYIDQLRRKVNNSAPVKMSLSSDALRGFKRQQIFIDPLQQSGNKRINVYGALKFLGENHPLPTQSRRKLESYWPGANLSLPINQEKALELGMVNPGDTTVGASINWKLNKETYMLKGDAAVLDIIASNIWERPIYFAVTCRQESLLGLEGYTQLEGLTLRIVAKPANGEPQYGLLGNGSVNTEAFFNNFMERFKWGNFDEKKLFVDNSYMPTVQTTRFGVLRTSSALIREGKKEKATQLLDRYFEAFPGMNFPYDANTMLFIGNYLEADAKDKAAKHALILAKEATSRMKYFDTLDPEIRKQSFERDYLSYQDAIDKLMALSITEFEGTPEVDELKSLLSSFTTVPLKE